MQDARLHGGPALRRPQAPQGDLLIGMQAGLKHPVRRDPDPVAAAAKPVAQGADQTHRSRVARHLEPLRYPLAGKGRKARAGLQHPFPGDKPGLGPMGAFPQRHQLDEADRIGLVPGQLHQGGDLVLIDAPHEHGVDLQLGKPCGFRRLYAVQSLLQLAPTGKHPVFIRVQGIQADV